jgi:hypothetical protein
MNPLSDTIVFPEQKLCDAVVNPGTESNTRLEVTVE